MADGIKNAPPSMDPANTGSMQGMFRHVLDKYMQDVDDMLPARVIAFNGDRNNPKVQIQIMYLVTKTDGNTEPMSQVASVPVVNLSGGGFVLSFPVKSGDMGWIKANDQDISLFQQSGEASPGNTKRTHSFEDAVFIPDLMKGWMISGDDQDKAVLQSVDGTVKLTLSTDTIRMDSNDKYVECSPSGIKSEGDWEHTGKMDITGDTTINGDVETIGSLKNNSVNVGSTHIHYDVTNTAPFTGTPVT